MNRNDRQSILQENAAHRARYPLTSRRVLPFLVLPLFPFILMFFKPSLLIWMGSVATVIVALSAIRRLRKPLFWIFRICPERPLLGAVKLTLFGAYSVTLILAGIRGVEVKEKHRLEVARRIARRAEEAQQVAAARVEKARLAAAANEQVSELVSEARSMLKAGDIDGATTKLTEARSVRRAKNIKIAERLLRQISSSGDADKVFEALLSLQEGEFTAFRDNGRVPPSLEFGFYTLNTRAIALATPQLERAAEVRAERERIAAQKARRQRAANERERVRLAAEARQRAAEQNRIRGEKHSTLAWLYMQQFVEKRLKAPGSAKFEFGGLLNVTHLGGLRYHVDSYVDAQNSFGADIRTYFEGVVKRVDGSWYLESLTFK